MLGENAPEVEPEGDDLMEEDNVSSNYPKLYFWC